MKKSLFILLFSIFAANISAPPVFAQESEYLSDSLMEISPIKKGDTVMVAGFYFEDGSSLINENLKKYLRKIAQEIKKIKYNKIYVDGYTDNKGDNSANNKLSRARANGVREELIKNGISTKKIQARAYGSIRPIAGNETHLGRVQNRRIEILVR